MPAEAKLAAMKLARVEQKAALPQPIFRNEADRAVPETDAAFAALDRLAYARQVDIVEAFIGNVHLHREPVDPRGDARPHRAVVANDCILGPDLPTLLHQVLDQARELRLLDHEELALP